MGDLTDIEVGRILRRGILDAYVGDATVTCCMCDCVVLERDTTECPDGRVCVLCGMHPRFDLDVCPDCGGGWAETIKDCPGCGLTIGTVAARVAAARAKQ